MAPQRVRTTAVFIAIGGGVLGAGGLLGDPRGAADWLYFAALALALGAVAVAAAEWALEGYPDTAPRWQLETAKLSGSLEALSLALRDVDDARDPDDTDEARSRLNQVRERCKELPDSALTLQRSSGSQVGTLRPTA